MDTYTLIELGDETHIELELNDDVIAVYVAGDGEAEVATVHLTEAQALELIAELSLKVAQTRLARAGA